MIIKSSFWGNSVRKFVEILWFHHLVLLEMTLFQILLTQWPLVLVNDTKHKHKFWLMVKYLLVAALWGDVITICHLQADVWMSLPFEYTGSNVEFLSTHFWPHTELWLIWQLLNLGYFFFFFTDLWVTRAASAEPIRPAVLQQQRVTHSVASQAPLKQSSPLADMCTVYFPCGRMSFRSLSAALSTNRSAFCPRVWLYYRQSMVGKNCLGPRRFSHHWLQCISKQPVEQASLCVCACVCADSLTQLLDWLLHF